MNLSDERQDFRPPGDPDDEQLVAQLDLSKGELWQELHDLTRAIAVVDEHDVTWTEGGVMPDGSIQLCYPIYGRRVSRAAELLSEVGAVTPLYHWVNFPLPEVSPEGGLSAADAVRAATAVVRGERFCDGNIGAALKDGTLHAVMASLVAWFDENDGGNGDNGNDDKVDRR